MEGMEQAIGSILSDPNAMAQIMSLAQSLGLGGAPAAPPDAPAPVAAYTGSDESEKLLQLLRSISISGAAADKHNALFQALRPYLSQHRRKKLDQAMQIIRLSRLAGTALRQGHTLQEGR